MLARGRVRCRGLPVIHGRGLSFAAIASAFSVLHQAPRRAVSIGTLAACRIMADGAGSDKGLA